MTPDRSPVTNRRRRPRCANGLTWRRHAVDVRLVVVPNVRRDSRLLPRVVVRDTAAQEELIDRVERDVHFATRAARPTDVEPRAARRDRSTLRRTCRAG